MFFRFIRCKLTGKTKLIKQLEVWNVKFEYLSMQNYKSILQKSIQHFVPFLSAMRESLFQLLLELPWNQVIVKSDDFALFNTLIIIRVLMSHLDFAFKLIPKILELKGKICANGHLNWIILALVIILLV